PTQIILALLALVHLDTVVNGHEAGTPGNGFLHLRVLGRSAAVIGEHDNTIGMREVFWELLHRGDDRVCIGIVGIDGPGQVNGGGNEFMIAARTVRARVADEYDSLRVPGGFLSIDVENVAILALLGRLNGDS